MCMRKERMLFFVILFALIAIPGMVMTPKFMVKNHLSNGKNGVYAKLDTEPENSLDIIVAGDSESYTTVSPMQLWQEQGYRTYVTGQPAAKLSDAESVIGYALRKQKPKVVLLETNTLFRQDVKQTDSGDKLAECLYRCFPLLKEHNAWKSPFIELKGTSYKGYVISSKVKPYTGGTYMKETKKSAEIDAANRVTLREIKKLCEAHGAQLVLYSAPSPHNYNYKKHNALVDLAKEERLPYLDLNTKVKELQIDWSHDTRDKGDHLNCYGAKKTTTYLGKYLKTHYSISDKRGDEQSEEWNELLSRYNKNLQKADGKARRV